MKSALTSLHRELHQNILRELGSELRPGACVLDYGCGAGNMVDEYSAAGYDTFGCDIRVDNETDRIRRIEAETSSLPFPDNTFDFVFSDQVMEHVKDHRRAFAEIKRVMKPDAVSLHIFPSKLKPVEAHVFVPLGGVMQSKWWLRIWALLGIRNSFQTGKSAGEVVELNSKYLKERTNYLSRVELVQAISANFQHMVWAESHMIKHSYGNARRLYPLLRLFPPAAKLYSALYARVIFLRKSD
jgi:SAM-dependent methyltransferase